MYVCIIHYIIWRKEDSRIGKRGFMRSGAANKPPKAVDRLSEGLFAGKKVGCGATKENGA